VTSFCVQQKAAATMRHITALQAVTNNSRYGNQP
jgi:hypothetical protein